MAVFHIESGCPSRRADNRPVFMVMVAFEMGSVESDKAKMSCHGLVIVLGTARICRTWEDEHSIQESEGQEDPSLTLFFFYTI